MSALADGFVLRVELDDGEYDYYSVDEVAGVEDCLVRADLHNVLKVYLTEEEAEGAIYEARYLYQKSDLDSSILDNLCIVPYVDCEEDLEYRGLAVEEG